MCFTYSDCDVDWYADYQAVTVERVDEPVRCVECHMEIKSGELCEHTHMTGDEYDDDDYDYPDVPQHHEWDGYLCGRCSLTRWLVHADELARGCREDESWCPFGDLMDYCYQTDFEVATPADGAAWLDRKYRQEVGQ